MTLPLPPISPRVDNPAAVVIGGANTDYKCQTSTRPVPATSNPGHVRTSLGGVGRNVAENLARLGVTTALVTAIGADVEGDRLIAETEDAGVDLRHVIPTRHHTGSYTAVLDDIGDLIIAVSAMDAMDDVSREMVDARRALVANARIVVLDCNVPEAALLRAAELARASEVPVIVDPVSVPKSQSISSLLSARIPLHTITPNLDELRELTGCAESSRADLCSATAQLHSAGVQNVWVSLGAKGSFLSSMAGDEQRVEMIAACPATLVDATGAGDAMLAGYALGLLRNMDPFTAARYGRAAAAITIESDRTVSPLLDLTALLSRVTRSMAAQDG